jgi:hypothetical protein
MQRLMKPSDRTCEPTAAPQAGELRRRSYTSLVELRAAIERIDSLTPITVVLVLDGSFSGHLSSLVRRRRPCGCGARLIIVAESGRLPGLETLGDLAMAGGSLGWQEIVLERDAATAVADARATLRDGERLTMFAPSWHGLSVEP